MKELFLKTWLAIFTCWKYHCLVYWFSVPLRSTPSSLVLLLYPAHSAPRRFNKQRLRLKRITPSLRLYKTCLFFHICCYNYTAFCLYSHLLFSYFLTALCFNLSLCQTPSSFFFCSSFASPAYRSLFLKLVEFALPMCCIKESFGLIFNRLCQRRCCMCTYLLESGFC